MTRKTMVFFWKRISDGLFGQRWWLCAPHHPPCFCSRIDSKTMGADGMILRSPLLLRGCWWQGFRCETHPRHPNGVRKIASLTLLGRGCPAAASHSQSPQKPTEKGEAAPSFLGPPSQGCQCRSTLLVSRGAEQTGHENCTAGRSQPCTGDSGGPEERGRRAQAEHPLPGAGEALCASASCPLHKCNFPECQRKALQITHCVCL